MRTYLYGCATAPTTIVKIRKFVQRVQKVEMCIKNANEVSRDSTRGGAFFSIVVFLQCCKL